ncbi:hypothetical protein ElyMa_002083200 [Elysia marginata]|uniref:Uncharacterized protein n=1 Tax=Elysia marginata TaxID=1093978 RepID=A0AAV4FES5_9GAST|nr:hypothetical protein ElyMa_002083200 [Elysia marginata]
MMRWLKDKKKERRTNSATYDDEGKEDDYGFEKERTRAASKSPSTRRQLPPTPATPEEKSPHIYEEIPDMACAASPPPQASTESHRKKLAPFGKKSNSGGKVGKDGGSKLAVGAGKSASGNKYTSDVSSPGVSGGVSKAKKTKLDDADTIGQYIGDDQSRQTPPNLHRNGTPEVHCDVIIKDTHCEILLSRKPKCSGAGSRCGDLVNGGSASSSVPHSNARTSSTGESYPSSRGLTSTPSWSQQSDQYIGPQAGRFSGQVCSRDRRASVDVHSSSKFTSAFSLALSSSSAAPVMGGASLSSGGAQNSGSASFSSSTSRLNSLGASSSFSVLTFSEPHQPKTLNSLKQRKQQQQQQESHVYEHMQAPQGTEENMGVGESAGSATSSAKGVETYTTASNFIARPTIVPFKPLPGAKDPCVEAFGRPLSAGSSSTDAAYASIRDEAVSDSAYQTAPLKNGLAQAGANSSVTYASIQDAEDKDDGLNGSSFRGQVAYSSIQDDQHLQQSTPNGTEGKAQQQRLFYGGNSHSQSYNLANSFQQSVSSKPHSCFQGPIRTGFLHRRSPSDSSSCTYASVSFPAEPKHYNTISDLGSGQPVSESRRRSIGTSQVGVAFGTKQHQAFPSEATACASDASDGIYSGVEPYRVKPLGFGSCAIAKGGATNRNSQICLQRPDFGMKLKNRASFVQQSLYADISSEQNASGRSDLYACIDPASNETDLKAVINETKAFAHSKNIPSNPSNTFLSPHNDLHRFAVDRSSFQIDFCTCSDDHASSCEFGDLTSAKTADDYASMNFTAGKIDKNSNHVLGGAFPGNANNADSNTGPEAAASSSCKDCGRLIKQITYSESYSDDTYEHAYSSRLLTRKSRRYSSPDITFSEISNAECHQDPPSYLQYRSSPSWSRRSPLLDPRVSRDDTWASSPRSDDVIPPAYGALDDNGFVSSHYERYSPTYARNRDKHTLTSSRIDSLAAGQKKIQPWLSASAFPEGLLDQNMADDAKARLRRGAEREGGSAFFSPNSNEDVNFYSIDKENTESKLDHFLQNDLEVLLPENPSGISKKTNSKKSDVNSNSRQGRQSKTEKPKRTVSPKSVDRNVIKNVLTESGLPVEEVETTDQIPDKNTKKLANYFQSLTTSKEALVGSEDSILMAQVDERDPPCSKGSKQLATYTKSSAFTKLPLHSASFCAPKAAESKRKKHPIYGDENNPGSQSSPDVSKARSRLGVENNKTAATSLALPTTSDPPGHQTVLSASRSGSNSEGSSRQSSQAETGSSRKPQNKTDSGDTCYEFDISTSSEGEQQSSYDNILSKVRISLNLEHEVQHIADSRAARRKRLLCRQCKKRAAAAATTTNVYSIVDDTACETETLGAAGTGDGAKGFLNAMDDDFGFMLDDDGMCPHLSLKFGELRAMLDNMFVDQRAAILDCLTDQTGTPNPYSLKNGGHGLHLCGQDLASLPAALQQLCRECGCEVMTSDSESITTIYSGSFQASQPGGPLRMTSPGSGPPQTPSCDSDEGTMADNSGDDDDDLSGREENKTKILKKNSPLSCGHVEGRPPSRKNSSPLDVTTKHYKHGHHRLSVSAASSNSGSTHSVNQKGSKKTFNDDDNDEANNSSGYDEPEEFQRQQYPVPRHERSAHAAHRTRKKEKRERKSATAHNLGSACLCCPEDKTTRKSLTHTSSSACTARSSHSSADRADSGNPKVTSSEKISKNVQNVNSGVQLRKPGSKKHGVTTQCACASPHCPRPGHSHNDHRQERSSSKRGSSADQGVYDREEEEEEATNYQQSTNSSSVSEKALKDIYSPLPAKALCLLTSRHTNTHSNKTNNVNDSEGIININNSSVTSSNSSSSSSGGGGSSFSNASTVSTRNLAVNSAPCTCEKFVTFEQGLEVEMKHPAYLSSSLFSCVASSSVPTAHKEKQTSAEVQVGTKDLAGPGSSTSRETDNAKRHGALETSSNEVASKETGNSDNNVNNNGSVGGNLEDEEMGPGGDNGVNGRGRVTTVQTHLSREETENKAPLCVNAPLANGGRDCAGYGGRCLPCCDPVRSGLELVSEKNAELCPHREGQPGLTCCGGTSKGCLCQCELSQQQQLECGQRALRQHHYRHHHSGKHVSLCSTDKTPSQRTGARSDSNSFALESPDHFHAPHFPPKPKFVSSHSPAFRDNVVKDAGADYSRRKQTIEGETLLGDERGKEVVETGQCVSCVFIKTSNSSANGAHLDECEANARKEKNAKNEERTGRCENKTAEVSPVGTCSQGRIPHDATVPSHKPPTTATTGDPTLNSSLQGVPGARREQCENRCSSTGQQGEPSLHSRDASSSHMQMKSPELPLFLSPVSSPQLVSKTAAPCSSPCAVNSTAVNSPSLNSPTVNSPTVNSPPVNSPCVNAKLVIPRKHKLELATLDLLPETALGSDMNDSENDATSQTSTTAEQNTPAVLKPRPRERAASKTKTNVVQKMAKLFEEHAGSNKPTGNNHEDCNRRGHSTSSPRGQRSGWGKAMPAAARASVATSAAKPDLRLEEGVKVVCDVPSQVTYLSPADPPGVLVEPSVQSSPDVLAHQCSEETDRPRVASLVSCRGSKARSRSEPLQDISVPSDCMEEKTLRAPGFTDTREQTASDGACTVLDMKTDCPDKGLHWPNSKSTDQSREKPATEKRLRFGVGERRATEKAEGETDLVKENVPSADPTRVARPRGSKMKHSDLLKRLKNANDWRSGSESYQMCPEDSSSASSSPSSTKKATMCSPAAVQDGGNPAGSTANTNIASSQTQQGKQKRYSKKPYHKRRSKSRTARRRSGSRAGADREERTYYYFSSDLSDIDVMEVDDWETYASSMSLRKQSQHATRPTAANVDKQEGAGSTGIAKDTPTNGSSFSPLKTRKKAELSLSREAQAKSRTSRELRETGNGGASQNKGNRQSPEETQSTGEEEAEDVSKDDVEVYHCISPTTTTTTNAAAAAAASASASSSPMASPELPKPRRSRRSACADGSGKSNQLEVYKTKRSSNPNKLLSELIIRNYDMQIYGNV